MKVNQKNPGTENTGLFITAEGIDGSGKSTQILLLAEWLESIGLRERLILTREPGGTIIGEKIRKIILDLHNERLCSTTELFLYAAARAQLVEEVIKPAISRKMIIICDRFTDSTLAYQLYGRELDPELVKYLNAAATGDLKPDMTLYFDIEPVQAYKRRTKSRDKQEQDRIESEGLAFHSRVHDGYLDIAKNYKDRVKLIDARRSVDEIAGEVRDLVKPMLIARGFV